MSLKYSGWKKFFVRFEKDGETVYTGPFLLSVANREVMFMKKYFGHDDAKVITPAEVPEERKAGLKGLR